MAIPAAVAVGGGALLLGLGALLLSGGSDGPAPRGPFNNVISTPPNGVTWDTIDAAMCLAYEAGARTVPDLLDSVLRRVWPAVPWPSQEGDHLSVTTTESRVRARVEAFALRIAGGEAVCDAPGPVIVDPPPPPPPDDPPVIDNIDPFVTNDPGGFAAIGQGSNPTLVARGVYNLSATQTGRIRSALACMATTGFNLLMYGRKRVGDDYGHGRIGNQWYDIAKAWSPANQNVRAAAVTGEQLLRRLGWDGTSVIQGTYGLPWMPPMTVVGNALVCRYPDPWDPRRNPPEEVIKALGWESLENMKNKFNTSPLAP